MTAFSNLRIHPRTGAHSPRVMDPEIHIIAPLVNLPGIYGFQLQDRPETGSVDVAISDTGGMVFDIVTTDPLAGQVYVDFNFGYCIFHNSDNGSEVVVNYSGIGTVASLENLAKQVSDGIINTDNLPEGITNLYFTQARVDALLLGLLDDRGNYDASSNLFPSTGGSGTAGAILKGDIWYISVAGTLGGAAVKVGDSLRALTDSPGQTAGNWSVLETNIGFVPENVANKDTDVTLSANSDTKYASQKAGKTYADANRLAAISNAKWTVSGNTLTLDIADTALGGIGIVLPKPGTNGLSKHININSPLSITLPTTTVTGSVAGIDTNQFASDPTVNLFAYVMIEDVSGTLTPYLMLSRSPNLIKAASAGGSYYHTLSVSTRTSVGGDAWDTAFIGKNGSVVLANTTCVCLGAPIVVQISRTNGRCLTGFSFATANGALLNLPLYNNRESIYQFYEPIFQGFSVDPTPDQITYRITGNNVYWTYSPSSDGTSNSSDFIISLPFSVDGFPGLQVRKIIIAYDSGVALNTAYGVVGDVDDKVLSIYTAAEAIGFTSSGSKGIESTQLDFKI